jgi:hypothetical protein
MCDYRFEIENLQFSSRTKTRIRECESFCEDSLAQHIHISWTFIRNHLVKELNYISMPVQMSVYV